MDILSTSVSTKAEFIKKGKAVLGIELGSTRIKAVLIDDSFECIASGSHTWENSFENGIWTYSIDDIWTGLQVSYSKMAAEVMAKYNVKITKLRSIGISAMMHGYLAFDKQDNLLVPFRTWRNTFTQKAADELTELFQYNIPQRWSIAHLYQAILNKEEHVNNISFITTLAGYVHWKLTGKKVLGVGDASGMFPIDSKTGTYNSTMTSSFEKLVAPYQFSWKLTDILPEVVSSGEDAGVLSFEGAKLLDISGNLEAGAMLCPPEGDAGTGMVATNSIAVSTGNVSAGTSVFAMIVLDEELKSLYKEIDMVTTPDGKPVAMVHCNNCTSEINAWGEIFSDFMKASGNEMPIGKIYDLMFAKALDGEENCGGLVLYNYHSGEPITGLDSGRPLFVRTPESRFTFANFMRVQLYSAIAALKMGMDILRQEDVEVKKLTGHGGFFKAPVAGQKIMAGAMETPVSVMSTAGEGGAWGIAVLAAYRADKSSFSSLPDYLKQKVFIKADCVTVNPEKTDIDGFREFMSAYKIGLSVEKAASEYIK